jgi:hypothetical protein
MVRSTLADPIPERFEAEFPGPLRRRLAPEVAGEAIVRGIERRAPRIIAPGRWAPISVLRGGTQPARRPALGTRRRAAGDRPRRRPPRAHLRAPAVITIA